MEEDVVLVTAGDGRGNASGWCAGGIGSLESALDDAAGGLAWLSGAF